MSAARTTFGRYATWIAIFVTALVWMLAPLDVLAAARTVAAEPPVRLRLGTQTSADRIVVESDRAFAMARSEDGNTTVLTFDRTLEGDVREVDLRLSRWILSSQIDGAVLRLQLRHRVELQPARSSGRRLILTFRAADPIPPTDNVAADTMPPALPALVAEDAADSSAVSATAPEVAAVVEALQTATAVDGGLAKRAVGHSESHPIPSPEPTRLPAADLAASDMPTSDPATSNQAEIEPVEGALSVRATRSPDDEVAIDYGWDRPVAAAAFQRDDRLWLVFAARATAVTADAFALARALEGSVLDADRSVGRDRLVFRLRLQPSLHAQFVPIDADPARTGWRLLLARKQGDSRPLPMPPVTALPDGSLRIAMSGNLIDLSDPYAGDRLMVMASAGPAATPFAALDLAQFEVLPSLAGLVVRPRRPDLIAIADGVSTTVGTSENLRGRARGESGPDRTSRPPVALGLAALGPDIGRVDRRTAEAALAKSPHDGAARARLVRVLLGLGLSAEARVVLGDAGAAQPTLAPLAAAVEALDAPDAVAAERFVGLGPADATEAALWRAFLHARHGDWKRAVVAKAASGDVLLDYPKALRAILGQAIVGAQIAASDIDGALATLDGLVARSDDRADQAAWKLLQARALLREGGTSAARRRLLQAADQGDTPTRLAAEAVVVDLDLQDGQLGPADADAAIDGLAQRSEGLAIAQDIARRQARIAAAAGDWDGALDAADRALSLPAPIGDAEPVAILPLLGQALAATDLDVFAKLRLLQGRSIEELRQPALAETLRDLALELDRTGQHATARALRAIAGQDEGSLVPPLEPDTLVPVAGAAALSPATEALAAALDASRGSNLPDLVPIDAALRTIARPGGS